MRAQDSSPLLAASPLSSTVTGMPYVVSYVVFCLTVRVPVEVLVRVVVSPAWTIQDSVVPQL
ncbi:hypothetical protein SHIRM173S_02209 [Streptomyces hirsutus]